MSQRIGSMMQTGISPPEYGGMAARYADLAMVERYLDVLESNRRACHADLTDADLALDMAGFVRRHLRGQVRQQPLSAAVLSLALVRRLPDAPEQ